MYGSRIISCVWNCWSFVFKEVNNFSLFFDNPVRSYCKDPIWRFNSATLQVFLIISNTLKSLFNGSPIRISSLKWEINSRITPDNGYLGLLIALPTQIRALPKPEFELSIFHLWIRGIVKPEFALNNYRLWVQAKVFSGIRKLPVEKRITRIKIVNAP